MKAVVFHGVGDVRVDDVPAPTLQEPTDAIIEISASAICGTDLHFIRGTVPGMRPGTILGHEAVGTVVEIGDGVHNLKVGDRVVASPTVACGSCSYCREGYFAQCDFANPHGRRAGTAFLGGPKANGGFDGIQAEFARIPFAHVGLVKLPAQVTNEQAILIADVFPSGYYGAELAEVVPGDVVAVFGCGPVGQFAIFSAFYRGAARVFAIDNVPSRLELARSQGAEVIDFDASNPVQALMHLTRGIGPDRVIDAVGVGAQSRRPNCGALIESDETALIGRQRSQVTPEVPADDVPSVVALEPLQSLIWAVDSIAKSGTLAVVGLYPGRFESFPLGRAFDRNLTVKMGMCHHRRYIPELIRLVGSGQFDPTTLMPAQKSLLSTLEAYTTIESGASGWQQVNLAVS